jgi:hypothetical protein
MGRRLLALAAGAAAFAAVRRARHRREELDLWTEATAPPDLR